MPIAPDCVIELGRLESALRKQHRGRVNNLTLATCNGGVELDGEAVSYHAIQLVIRDVLSERLRIRRNRISVNPVPDSVFRRNRIEPRPRDQTVAAQKRATATSPNQRLLLACGDATLTTDVAARMSAAGYDVDTATTGVNCYSQAARRRPDVLVFVDSLLWGGADGVIEMLAERGRLGRCAVFYIGTEAGLGRVTTAVRRRLTGVRYTRNACAESVLNLVLKFQVPE